MSTNMMQSLLRYGRPYERDYGVRFINVCITDRVVDIISSKCLAAMFRTEHIRYTKVRNMMIKH